MRTNLTLLSLFVVLCTAGCSSSPGAPSSPAKSQDNAVRVGMDPHRSQPVPTARIWAPLPAR